MIAKRLAATFVACIVLALLVIAGGYAGLWQTIDHIVFRALYLPEPPKPASGLRLIDVAYPEELKKEDNPEGFRKTLGQVLQNLADMPTPPRTVVIDIFFSKSRVAQDAVLAGIKALQKKGTRVVATVSTLGKDNDSAEFMEEHNKAIYMGGVDAYGHTRLEAKYGVLKYERDLVAPAQGFGELHIPALPTVATVDPAFVQTLPASLVIPLGDDAAFAPNVHRYNASTSSFEPPLPASPAMSHVIIGSLAEDSKNVLNRPGPLLLAWAMSDLLAGKASTARAPLTHWSASLGLSTLAVALVVLVYAAAYRLGVTRVAPSRSSGLTLGAAGVAFGAAIAGLLGIGFVLLQGGQVAPLALPMLCALLASVTSAYLARRDMVNRQTKIEMLLNLDDRPIDHDVFVSYVRHPPENMKWVEDNILGSLLALEHEDGTAFSVFVDKSSIEIGTEWKNKVDRSILGTRVFVAVVCSDYFKSPTCVHEIQFAARLRVSRGQSLEMILVVRDALEIVPMAYQGPNLMQAPRAMPFDTASFQRAVRERTAVAQSRVETMKGPA